jgi:tetratricopeptide (TPR) repeat protein
MAGAAEAEKVRRRFAADIVLWGEVPKQGESLKLFLLGAGQQQTQTITFDKGLARARPDDTFGPVLAAVALAQIAPATEEAGRYLADRLQPVATRLKALLADPRLVPVPQRGSLHHALGLALAVIGEQTGDNATLTHAVAAYRAALEERTRKRVPLNWAATQNNLGNTLLALGEREIDTERMLEAVAAYRAALEEQTRKRVPLGWAMTQNNLGNALLALGKCETGTERILEAVAAYRAALEERTRKRVPLDWAMTQNNLGNALWALGECETGTERMLDAIAAYRAALEVFTPETTSRYWQSTQANLSKAEALLDARS